MYIVVVDLGVVVYVDNEWVIWDFDTEIHEKSWFLYWSWNKKSIALVLVLKIMEVLVLVLTTKSYLRHWFQEVKYRRYLFLSRTLARSTRPSIGWVFSCRIALFRARWSSSLCLRDVIRRIVSYSRRLVADARTTRNPALNAPASQSAAMSASCTAAYRIKAPIIVIAIAVLGVVVFIAIKVSDEIRFLQRKRLRLQLQITPLRGLSVCRLSQSRNLLKLFDGFRCHFAGTPLVGAMTHCVLSCGST